MLNSERAAKHFSVSRSQSDLAGKPAPSGICVWAHTHTFPSFVALHGIIHPRATTEFIYRYNNADRAHVFLSFKLATASRAKEVSEMIVALQELDMKAFDISDDEMAKSHARYMIGGCSDAPNERLYRFGAFRFNMV